MIKNFNTFEYNRRDAKNESASEHSNEYNEGLEAAELGKIPPDNPYEKGTKQYEDWLDGLIDGSL